MRVVDLEHISVRCEVTHLSRQAEGSSTQRPPNIDRQSLAVPKGSFR